MITINNSTTDQAATDSALAVGCIDHDNPGTTTTVGINFVDLTTEQQTVYADFFALGNGRGWVNIAYDCVIGIDHITSEVVISDTLDLDYNTMSVEDKAKVDAFRNLMNDLNNA
jgi:hypothetical protein